MKRIGNEEEEGSGRERGEVSRRGGRWVGEEALKS